MHRVCNRIFDHVAKRVGKDVPVFLGSGNGSFGGGARKGERGGSVPVKEMLKFLRSSFKRLGRRGMLYSNVDEYMTTQMCCVHHILTDKYHSKNRHGRRKKYPNANVRSCAQCVQKCNIRGFVDRDGNAALNILSVTVCILRKLKRPVYLQRPKKAAEKRIVSSG